MKIKDERDCLGDRRHDIDTPKSPLKDTQGVTITDDRRDTPDRRINNIEVEWISDVTKDRRERKKLTDDDVRKILNRKQLDVILECQYFGWRVRFIRCPLFQEPVPLLFNDKYDQIGLLEPDGHINLDFELEVRPHKPKPDQTKQPPLVQKAADAASWEEKRRNMVSVPDNLGELLNKKQMCVLRTIEKFGWQLHFVRRPPSREPIPMILNPKGDKFATLERDGRIKVTPSLSVRKEAPVEQENSAPSVPASKIKRAT